LLSKLYDPYFDQIKKLICTLIACLEPGHTRNCPKGDSEKFV
jgi:hypothetical protein